MQAVYVYVNDPLLELKLEWCL